MADESPLAAYLAKKGAPASTAPAAPPRATASESPLTAYLAKKEAKQKPSQVEAALRGGFQGLTMDWGDEIVAGLESAFTEKTYDQAVKETRGANARAKAEYSLTYGAGQVAGAVAGGLATGGSGLAAKAGLTGIKAAATLGAASGALQNLGASEDKSIEDALWGAATGAIVGGVAGKVTGSYIDTAPARAAKMAIEKPGNASVAGLSVLLGAHDLATGGAAFAAGKALQYGNRAATKALVNLQERSWTGNNQAILDAIRGAAPGAASGAGAVAEDKVREIMERE